MRNYCSSLCRGTNIREVAEKQQLTCFASIYFSFWKSCINAVSDSFPLIIISMRRCGRRGPMGLSCPLTSCKQRHSLSTQFIPQESPSWMGLKCTGVKGKRVCFPVCRAPAGTTARRLPATGGDSVPKPGPLGCVCSSLRVLALPHRRDIPQWDLRFEVPRLLCLH